jgi:shikimate kinase
MRRPDIPPQARPIVLIGFMAAGKTTVGRQLAIDLGRPFIDLDQLIIEKCGMSIPTLFATRGEGTFRNIEAAVLQGVLEPAGAVQPPPPVISSGGGVVIRQANRFLIRDAAWCVFLHPPWQVLHQRLCGAADSRPLVMAANSEKALRDLWQSRLSWYEQTAHLVLREAGVPDELCPRIIAAMEERGPHDTS